MFVAVVVLVGDADVAVSNVQCDGHDATISGINVAGGGGPVHRVDHCGDVIMAGICGRSSAIKMNRRPTATIIVDDVDDDDAAAADNSD